MSNIRTLQEDAQTARAAIGQAEKTLYARQNRLRSKDGQLAEVKRQGKDAKDTMQGLEREIQTATGDVTEDLEALDQVRNNLRGVLTGFSALEEPWELVEQLDDKLPFLLFPVRIEARFMRGDEGTDLWVRIFPDDIAIQTHEETLTADELDAGKTYWRQWRAAQQDTDTNRGENAKKGAWRALAEAHGETRAAWIRKRTESESLEELKEETWSQAPTTKIMPDRFVVLGYDGGKEIFRQAGEIISSSLKLGPDPQKEREFQQKRGELEVGEDIAWIYDFDKAQAAGMAVKIKALDEPYSNRGFGRLLVLGLRLSSSETENRALIEELFNNHHYSSDGMSLVPQGTPTNNTDSKGSGFSSVDPGAETSQAVETDDVPAEPSPEFFKVTDGQRLEKALGIPPDPERELLKHVRFAGRYDVEEAMAMNKALWPGTLGYYLEQLLELDLDTIGQVREFFTDYVTGRGPLPTIRVGTQPYGVLLTSDFAHWKWSPEETGEDFQFLSRLHDLLSRAETTWQRLVPRVPRIGADGDPHENLMRILGLQATSAEFHRRRMVGKQYLWNYAAFAGKEPQPLIRALSGLSRTLLQELDFGFGRIPKLFDLGSFQKQDFITDPLVDDIPEDKTELWSESTALPRLYSVSGGEEPANYIGWLLYSDFDDIRHQIFKKGNEQVEAPRALLYRMLRGALLLAYYDATMQLYSAFGVLPPRARRELEFLNIRAEPDVTRWERMEADVSKLSSKLGEGRSVASYLETDGLARPEAQGLREVRQCLEALKDLPTARLERLFVEHVDLCSYRLDAWQTGCFHRRLHPPPPKPPVIASFTATPETINQGQSAVLSWRIVNRVDNLTLEPGIGDITGESSVTVSPATTTTYTLTATNSAGSSTKQIAVKIVEPPVIDTFDAEPKRIHHPPGGSATLTWQVRNVDSLTLESKPLDKSLCKEKPEPCKVTGESVIVTPAPPIFPTKSIVYSYTLRASNSAGSRSKEATVEVSIVVIE